MTGAGLTIDELAAVFSKAGTDLVLIGGQAVAAWALQYSDQLKLEEAILSDDIDFWGTRDQLTALARKLKVKADYPDSRVMTNLSGIIRVRIIDRVINIDVLHHVPGLEGVERDRVALPLAFGEHSIMVLDPISLIVSKLHNLRNFDQKDRSDLQQLLMSIRITRLFVGDAFQRSVRVGLNYCKRIMEIALNDSHQTAFKKHLIDIFAAFPIDKIRSLQDSGELAGSDRDKLIRFLNIQWARLEASGRLS